MRRFSEMDKHYDRHNKGICAVCGCTTAPWKFVCDSCRYEIATVQGLVKDVQGLIKKEELKAGGRMSNPRNHISEMDRRKND